MIEKKSNARFSFFRHQKTSTNVYENKTSSRVRNNFNLIPETYCSDAPFRGWKNISQCKKDLKKCLVEKYLQVFLNCYLMQKILINTIHNLDLVIMLPYLGKSLPQTGTKAIYIIKKIS